MSGIYIHIPFCAKKCYYCDFFMSLSLKYKDDYLKALKQELLQRKNYIENQIVETIYFGGGTPSLLNEKELNELFELIYKTFKISDNPEITIEANPDDLNKEYLKNLRKTPVNRLSIGIQSFFDDDLKLMNRRHLAEQSIAAVKNAQNTGYQNISGDLIYGLPEMTSDKWEKNLQKFFNLRIQHLSAYHLTYEPNTVFYKRLKTGKLKEISEEESLFQFQLLNEKAKENDFIHYETSNFAKQGKFSRHNSAYWQQKHYLGIGASAHSYNEVSRQFNIKNIKEYIKRVSDNSNYFEKEILSNADKYNDYLITSLRTMWGSNINEIEKTFGKQFAEYFINKAKTQINKGNLLCKENIYMISEKGKFIEDLILSDLIFA